MADVFISYSREESREFVDRLYRALEARQKDAWVDREIPGGAEWEAEIRDEILKSHAFVFVISPAAFRHDGYCLEELDHAIAFGKRILPLQYRPVTDDSLPEAIKTHNWIPSQGRFEDTFDEHVTKLVEAIDTDLEWVDSHTRLGARADEWQASRQDRSRLLRGSELEQAEQWLAGQAGKEPAPTSLHSEYISASRAASGRRQRAVVGAVSIALVVAVALAIVALVQRNHANQQRRAAVSRALAANAFLQLKSDPELSLLLAIKAAETSPTQEAQDALKQGLIESRVLRTLRGHRGAVNGAIFSPNGRLVLSWGEDATARLWDARTGRQLHSLRGHRVAVHDASFSKDGRRVLTVAQDGTARLWSVESGGRIAVIRDRRDDRMFDARFSPDGRMVVTSNFMDVTRLWRSGNGSFVRKLGDTAAAVAFSPDGSLVLTAGEGQAPTLWNVRTGRGRRFPQDRQSVFYDADFSPDGKLFVTAGGPGQGTGIGKTDVREVASGRLVAALPQGATVRDVAFSPNGAEIATAGDNGTARLWGVRQAGLVAELPGHSGTVNSVAFSPDGRSLVTGGNDGTTRIWDAASGQAVAVLAGQAGPIRTVAFDPRGQKPEVVTASADGTSRIWDASTSGPAFALRTARRLGGAGVMSGDGRRLASEEPHGVAIRNSATGHVVSRIATRETLLAVSDDSSLVATEAFPSVAGGTSAPHELVRIREAAAGGRTVTIRNLQLVDSAAFSPDASKLALGGHTNDNFQGFAEVWNTRTGQPITRLLTPKTSGGDPSGTDVLGLNFSPDGNSVAALGRDGRLRVWDLGSATIKMRTRAFPSAPSMAISSPATFSPDGSLVVAGAEWDVTGGIWDAGSGEELARLGGHSGGINSARFSPDGRFVVTGSVDGSARIWDPVSGAPLAILPAFDRGGLVDDAAFIPSGAAVSVVGGSASSDELKVFSCDACRPLDQLLILARKRVTRRLTPAEQARYLGTGG